MDHTTIRNEQAEEMVVNIGDLRQRFGKLTEGQGKQGKIYPLWFLLAIPSVAAAEGVWR